MRSRPYSPALVLAGKSGWMVLDGPHCRPMEPYSPLERPVRLLWVPGQESLGTMSLQGKPAFAPALIERRLRDAGEIELDSIIWVHQLRLHGGSYTALYSAIPLQEWQRMQAWIAQQPVQCIAYVWGSLLGAGLAQTGVRVLEVDRSLACLCQVKGQLSYHTVGSFSSSPEDLALAGQSLAQRLRQSGPQPLPTVEWGCLLQPADAASGASRAAFEAELGQACTRLDPDIAVNGAGSLHGSCVPRLAASLHVQQAINPAGERWLYGLSRWVLPASALLLLGAALGLLLAGRWWLEARALDANSAALLQEAQRTAPAGAAASARPRLLPPVEREHGFAREAQRRVLGVPVHRLLHDLKQAGQGKVRILSVRIEPQPLPPGSPPREVLETTAVLEGLLPEERRPSEAQLTDFVNRLAALGWKTEPATYRDGATGGSMGGRLFAFRVTERTEPGGGAP